MKTFVIACIAAIVIAVIGAVALNSFQEPVDEAFAVPSSVRLGA